MSPIPSPEIEAIVRRVIQAWQKRDFDTMAALFTGDAILRVIGFDKDEYWAGPEEFLGVFRSQAKEMPDWIEEFDQVVAFEDHEHGWATILGTLVIAETRTPIRHSAVLRMENGNWRVIQWQNAIPVPNEQVFGVELTTTLGDLVTSVLDDHAQLSSAAGSEGTMTLVFTDIVDSTVLAESLGDRVWAEIVRSHEATIRRITASEGGIVVKVLGDGAMLAFVSARAALRAAVEIQRAFTKSNVSLRIGIHTGEVVRTSDDLFGLTVNKAARIAATAGGGEIIASSTTRDLVGSMPEIHNEDAKVVALKGMAGNHPVVSIGWR